MTQPELMFARSCDEQYERWKQSEHGRAVIKEACRRAMCLRRRGFSRYGIKCILEAVRFDWALQFGTDDSGFKINNNVASRLSRDLMRMHPELNGFFDTRKLRS